MAKRERLGLTAVRTEGAILPASILQRIHREDPGLDGLKPEQYDLTGDRLREAASRAWTALQGPWMNFKAERAKLAPSEAGTTITRNRWLYPILRELHFGPLEPLRESLKYDEKEFPVSHKFGHSPLHLIGCNLALDKRTPGAVGAAKMSPHGLLQSCLNSTKENLWGFVTNGLQWRVLRDDNSLSRQSMVEFDLESIFEGQLYDEFLLFFLICHRSRVQSELPEQCWLEQWSQAAGEDGKRALNTLRDGVQKSIEALGQGFLRHPANNALRTRIRNGELDKQDYYRQLLRMVYRLLFLFVAEDRGLLLDPKAKDTAKALFNEHFSTQRLRLLAERMRGSSRHHDIFNPLKMVLSKLGEPAGCPELALPALGGFLFTEATAPDLDSSEIANADLLEAIRFLAVTREGGRLARVDYKNLGTEELGSVYESLLELHPELASDGTWFELKSASGNERKTSGSYYTPDSLIQCLLDSALDPVVNEAIKKAGTDPEARAKAILDLRVIDPAAGSGHFLIAASHRLAKRLAQVRTGEDEPSPDVTRHAMREVVSRCIYGIDINPMAAELCKVSLWMEALEPGKPLNFLDHHIRVGNSLLGATPELLAAGIPDEAFVTSNKMLRPIAAALRKQNRLERDGWSGGGLFAEEDSEILRDIGLSWQRLESMAQDSLSDVTKRIAFFHEIEAKNSGPSQVADAWCSSFLQFEIGTPVEGACLSTKSLRDAAKSRLSEHELDVLQQITARVRFIHQHLCFPDAWASGGFDVVIGNPPFVNAIEGNILEQERQLSRFLLPLTVGTADLAFQFLELATRITRPGGRIGLVQPRTMLSAPSTLPFRQATPRGFRPVMLYAPDSSHLFPGALVFVVCVVLAKSGELAVATSPDPLSVRWSVGELLSDDWWKSLQMIATGEAPDESGSPLDQHFEVTASMTTGEAYELKPYVVDDRDAAALHVITTGLIDPKVCLWGVRACKYLGEQFEHPTVRLDQSAPASLRKRAERALRPKILIAGLSKKIEAFLDEAGECIGMVSTFTITHPADDVTRLRLLLEHLLSEEADKQFRLNLGSSLVGGGDFTMKRGFLRELRLPASVTED